MTVPSEVSIVDIVSEGRYKAMFALHTFFGTEDLGAIAPFAPLVLAMQGLPDQLIADVGITILERFFEENALDPKTIHGRSLAAPFADVLTQNINSAAQAIFRQMQAQQEQQNRTAKSLMNGTLGRG